MRHIVSVLLEDEPGALARVSNLFTARGYNIETLSVAPTHDAGVSRMTVVTLGDDGIVEQIVKQLNKLVDVIKLLDVTEGAHVERELMLLKVKAGSAVSRDEVQRLADVFGGRLIDITKSTMVIEVVGGSGKLAALAASFDPADVIEVVRSGPCAISRGSKALKI